MSHNMPFSTGVIISSTGLGAQIVSDKEHVLFAPKEQLYTNMEVVVPSKMAGSSAEIKAYNKSIDKLKKHAKPCEDAIYSGLECTTAQLEEVMVTLTAEAGSHFRYFMIPGSIEPLISPYRMFVNYEFEPHISRPTAIRMADQSHLELTSTSGFFDGAQPLPNQFAHYRHAGGTEDIEISVPEINGRHILYLIAKDDQEIRSVIRRIHSDQNIDDSMISNAQLDEYYVHKIADYGQATVNNTIMHYNLYKVRILDNYGDAVVKMTIDEGGPLSGGR